jgi:hypothetical protein
MHPSISHARNTLEQLGWRDAIVTASVEALEMRRQLRDMTGVAGRVSVVTVCFNAADTIASALRSVEAQYYGDIEYIVVDGGSTDGTLETVKACGRVDLAISLRDKGIADAFNRGAALASGEFIAFLNADDVWPANHLAKAITALSKNADAAFVFGDLVRADEAAGHYYVMRGDTDYRAKLRAWPPEFNHPSFVTRRSAFEMVGLFDLDYRICMDLEWLIRLDIAGLYGRKVDDLWVVMRCGGVSDQFDRMFGDVKRILLSAGVSRGRVNLLLLKARMKTATKRLLVVIGAAGLADAIRQRLNDNFVASNPGLVELARDILRSTASAR